MDRFEKLQPFEKAGDCVLDIVNGSCSRSQGSLSLRHAYSSIVGKSRDAFCDILKTALEIEQIAPRIMKAAFEL